MAIHPDFDKNRWIYLSFVAGNGVKGYSTEVIRGELVGHQLSHITSMFVALPKTKGGRHFGSRLLLQQHPDKQATYLYISLGDRGVRSQSQQLHNHHGSIIRLYDNGEIPEDNPFVRQQRTHKNIKTAIFSYGHRNVQGLALHPITQDVWSHEHGPQGGDELNRIEAGQNYGWPVITYGVNYGIGTKIGEGTHKDNMQQPAYFWDPSIAPSGLAFYTGDHAWNNSWLVGALKFQLLAVLSPSTSNSLSEARYLEQQYGRIRDVKVYNHRIYLLTDDTQGKLIELTPSIKAQP